MIRSFRDRSTADLFDGRSPPRWRAIEAVARRKLDMLDAAGVVGDLGRPPGNRLEKLAGDRAGQWSIRINDQWRICFAWDDGAHQVEIVDYH